MDKTYRDKTYQQQNVSGQNVSTQYVSPTKRMGYKTYWRQNESADKRSNKQIGENSSPCQEVYCTGLIHILLDFFTIKHKHRFNKIKNPSQKC